jgi:hypothetical protein
VALSRLGQALPFAPTLGAENPQLDAKWMRFQAMDRRETVNCVVIGSSMVNQGVDPDLLSQLLSEQPGKPWRCFNLGLATLTGELAGVMGQLAVQETQPRLLVYGLSLRDLSAQFGDLSRKLNDAPWIQYRLGDPLPDGWLFDHAFLYRYNMSFKSWLTPANRPALQEYQAAILSSGYSPTREINPETDLTEPLIQDFAIHQEDWEGLQAVAGLNGEQTRVVIIEMPVQESFMPLYVEGGEAAYEALFVHPVADYLASQGIPFLRFQDQAGEIPVEGWYDQRHFNIVGGQLFTTWLAGELKHLEGE